MKAVLYPRHDYAAPRLEAFAAGLVRHGIAPAFATRGMAVDCDLAVIWSHKETAVIDRQRAAGRDYLVLEQGFVGDRARWTSAGFNGLNGRADFVNKGSPPDRWHGLFADLMRPWRVQGSGQYILFLLQVPGDAAISMVDYAPWVARTIRALETLHGLPVFVRHHPVGRFPQISHPEIKGDLVAALENAEFAVTFSSTAAVDAVLAGVPTITMDPGAMAWPVTGHDLAVQPPRAPREQWAHDLAYAQWADFEMRRGACWDHLKHGLMAGV